MPLQLFAAYKELSTLRVLILFRVPRAHCQLAKFQSTINKYISISLIADFVSKIPANIWNILFTGTFVENEYWNIQLRRRNHLQNETSKWIILFKI